MDSTILPTGVIPAILVAPLLLIVRFGFIRSTSDHGAMNSGTVALSNASFVIEPAPNSTYKIAVLQ
jgi:hypothetical protein